MPPSQTPFIEQTQGRETLRRSDRIRRRSHYLTIRKLGERVHTANFVVALIGTGSGRRLGITVTKRVKNAVHRNRIKRLVREVFRRNRQLFPEGSDVVVIARPGAEKLDYGRVREEFKNAERALCKAARSRGPAGLPCDEKGNERQS